LYQVIIINNIQALIILLLLLSKTHNFNMVLYNIVRFDHSWPDWSLIYYLSSWKFRNVIIVVFRVYSIELCFFSSLFLQRVSSCLASFVTGFCRCQRIFQSLIPPPARNIFRTYNTHRQPLKFCLQRRRCCSTRWCFPFSF
jgi:hypothetical protein